MDPATDFLTVYTDDESLVTGEDAYWPELEASFDGAFSGLFNTINFFVYVDTDCENLVVVTTPALTIPDMTYFIQEPMK